MQNHTLSFSSETLSSRGFVLFACTWAFCNMLLITCSIRRGSIIIIITSSEERLSAARREIFLKSVDCRRYDLVYRLHGLVNLCRFIVYPGDGEKVFNHIQKASRRRFYVLYYLMLIPVRQLVLILRYELLFPIMPVRRPQIVRDGSEKISSHFLLLDFHEFFFPVRPES